MKYYSGANDPKRSPGEIESDVREIRSDLAYTLERLEQRFSPRSIVDQVFTHARGLGQGSGEFVGNLGATVRDNPIPVVLLAAGVASLIASEHMSSGSRARRFRAAGPLEDWHEEEEEELIEPRSARARAAVSRAREAAGLFGERAKQRSTDLRERARQRSTDMRERARQSSSQLRERMRGTAAHARERGTQTLDDEPLVVVGLGIALGALVGSSLPVSARERRTLGPTHERVFGARRAREDRTRFRTEAARAQDPVGGDPLRGDDLDPELRPTDVDDAETDERMES